VGYFTENFKRKSPILPLSRDPKDDYLLIFAADYEIDFLVTGDKDLLVLQQWHNTRIITFSDFIKELELLNDT
jgi:hypothetical protein